MLSNNFPASRLVMAEVGSSMMMTLELYEMALILYTVCISVTENSPIFAFWIDVPAQC